MLPPPVDTRPHARRVEFVDALVGRAGSVALLEDGTATTYAELAKQVEAVGVQLGTGRRLVLIATSATRQCVVAYLAALAGGHVALLVGGDNPAAEQLLRATYPPDVVVSEQHGWVPQHLHLDPAHELHPDLAVLLSTSGSTGSPKLVRLSHANLQANAEAIVEYLALTPDDVGVTTLPLHYCYGLSVLHSHLAAGAGVLLSRASVVDPGFWDAFAAAGGTSLAGVPYTFELLERLGPDALDVPTLRTVTQAGGRLAPDKVTALADAGRRLGFDLYLMYGQTEATARMAYLPPHLVQSHPTCVGVPVPGGRISIEPPPADQPGAGDGVGELVYRGPNVMLGYARHPEDLALGRTVEALRTGDLARLTSDGLIEIVGRTGRSAKLFGQRIDLEHVEQLLAGYGYSTAVTHVEETTLVVAVEGDVDADWVGRLAAEDAMLPRYAVTAVAVEALPRLASGKVDLTAVTALASQGMVPRAQGSTWTEPDPSPATSEDLLMVYADLLERPDATLDDTFVGLGGDSLSYVCVSVELERILGHLPQRWHVTPVRDLQPRRRRLRGVSHLDSGIVVRAVASVLIVATHVGVVDAAGSAHVLLALAGYNFARFQLDRRERSERVRGQLRSVLRIAVPTVVWIAAVMLLLDTPYGPLNLTLLNSVLGPPAWDASWHFWFIEVLVWTLAGLALLTALPWVDRIERLAPFALPVSVLAVGLTARFGLLPFDLFHPKPVLWLFALGWATARAERTGQRLALTAIAVACVPGFFDDPRRDGIILVGVLLVLWVRQLPVPTVLVPVASNLAAASLCIYLTHWQVYPWARELDPVVAVVAALLVGVGYLRATQPLTAWVTSAAAPRQRRPGPLSTTTAAGRGRQRAG